MAINLNTAMIGVVEHDIAPPMAKAVTIPVVAQAGARGMDATIYISTSCWPRGVETSRVELEAIAREIARRIEAGNE